MLWNSLGCKLSSSELSWMIFGTWLNYNYCLNFYRCFGGEILEGYGMTETSCIISAMDVGDKSIGHVGSPIASCGKLLYFNFKDTINSLG